MAPAFRPVLFYSAGRRRFPWPGWEMKLRRDRKNYHKKRESLLYHREVSVMIKCNANCDYRRER